MVSFLDLENVLHVLDYQVKSYRIHRDSFLKTSFPMFVKIEDDPRFPHKGYAPQFPNKRAFE